MQILLLSVKSILLGFGLAMDAFSVSIANGIANPYMKKGKRYLIAGTFAVFQFLMPLIGWGFVEFFKEKFAVVNRFIPWIALVLLLFIGGKMIVEAIRESKEAKAEKSGADSDGETGAADSANVADPAGLDSCNEVTGKNLTFAALIVQGIATSIDALSVGFTIADYNFLQALAGAAIIGVVTFVICIFGVFLGRKVGMKLANRATIVGGIILIAIGLEIFIKGVFF
jgi:putative Mn2+ efflux pump MntP